MFLFRMLLLLLAGLVGAGEPPIHPGANGVDDKIDLVMPGARPETDDSYLCAAFKVSEMTGFNDTVYITGFLPNANANKAHHMLLYTCQNPVDDSGKIYNCLHHGLCKGGSSIMFAWAKNAPPTTLPKDVAFTIDPAEKAYLVLQVHYAHPLADEDHTGLSLTYELEQPKYQAGILLMMQGGLRIPGNTPTVNANMNCALPATVPLHFFSFRTHAHSLGAVISGYAYNEEKNEYRQIAKGSPQWPQAFYPMSSVQTIKPNEYIAARCTYNSTGRDRDTYIGATAADEMCNLYMMFFTEPGKSPDFLICGNEMSGSLGKSITRGLPHDSEVPPPKNPNWEKAAKDSNVDTGINEINYSKLFEEELENSGSNKKGGVEDNVLVVANFNFTMPGATPENDDDYLCTSVKMKDLDPVNKLWILKFSALTTGNRAHHMILSKCKQPLKKEGEIYDCRHHQTCLDQSKIMFAWAKHAQPTELPYGAGFAVDPEDYLVLQVHYAKALSEADYSGLTLEFTSTVPKYTAGIFLLGRSNLHIPADTETTHGDANCKVEAKSPLHIFAYRAHAHSYGSVITGYRYNSAANEWKLLAKGNPRWPQAFYQTEEEIVNPGEILAARCSYNTTGHHQSVKIGFTGGDEMCNLYLMYYSYSKDDDFKICFDEEKLGLAANLPEGNDVPLPPNPELEHKAHGETEQSHDDQGRDGKNLPGSDYSVVPNWPSSQTASSLGQISGVALDIYGNVVIFHRGDRVWNGNSFNSDNTYGMDKTKPIAFNTVVTVNSTGDTVNSWGKNLFFLPHMITVDSQNNIWMTDVALHQVFKFPPYGGDQKPLLTLGTRFEPGADDSHYCKPTSVAVSADARTFYVSDGYCNSRIIKYSITVTGDGKHAVNKVTEWGKGAGPFSISKGPYNFNVPHSLALAEDRQEICVADRENGRVQCFNTDSGSFTKSIQPKEFGSRIFAVAYSDGKLYAVNGPEFNPFGMKPMGYIVNMDTGKLDGTFQVPDGLKNPHDVTISKDGGSIYVVELSPYVVWKLTNGQPSAPVTSPSLPGPGSTPTADNLSQNLMNGAKKLMPEMSYSVVLAAAISVPLTILIACCLAVRKCRKRGKGTMSDGKKKNWNLGDILGRSKDGFQPVNTEERDGLVGDDSDSEVEEFSVPALHA